MSTRSEIETKLNTWAKSQVPPIPVAYENVPFTKPTDGPYIEIVLLNSTAINRNLATDVRIYGKFQINVCAPINNGMGVVDALVDSVIALYPVLPKTGSVSIEQPLNDSPKQIVDNFVCVPITGNYRTES